MKLSPNAFGQTNRNTTIESWIPEELTEFAGVSQELVTEISNLFVKDEDNALEVSATGRVAKLTVEDISQVRWSPLELERVVLKAPQAAPTPTITLPVVEPVPAPVPQRETLRLSAEEEAQAILQKAEREAAEIVRRAQATADEIRTAAHQEGVAKGLVEVEQLTSAAKAVLEQASQWHSEMLDQAETVVIDLVKEIARALFFDGFTLDDAQLQMTLSRIMANARTLGDLRIYLNPEDAVRLDPSWRDFQISITNQRIQVVGSESILPGGCFIDGQNGTVDGRMETRLKMILDAIQDEGDAA